ncbi:hypothetical protein Leryth_015476 [Lithospermum erythrorhizon]|nr:hypothetical protein Leryth_015476 [Lithospermum erythrorhizon]
MISKRSRSGNSMEAPDNKVQVAVKQVENKYQTCVSNYEDHTFELDASLGEHVGKGNTRRTKESDLVNIGHSEQNALVEEKYQDSTESSSSFDDVFGDENGGVVSDDEAVSDFREGDSFDRHVELFRMRKKRLTSHWRTYIQPLMWRCKWVELKIKNLNMQERNYAKELTKYDQEESLQNLCTREVPFSGGSRRHQILKRKRRKRIEDRVDVKTYMSQHNVFSFYENNKAPADGICFHDEGRNLENRKSNDEFELDEVMGESVRVCLGLKGQVSKLKTRLDKVISVNAGNLSYTGNPSLLVQCNALTSSGPDSASPPNNGDRVAVGSSYIASQLISQHHVGDVVLPESAVSSHGEVTHLSDKIESTNQPELDGPCHIEDEILIYNETVRDGMNNFDEVNMQPPAAVEVDQGNPISLDSNMLTDDQPPTRMRSISKLITPNTRKSQRKRRRRRS